MTRPVAGLGKWLLKFMALIFIIFAILFGIEMIRLKLFGYSPIIQLVSYQMLIKDQEFTKDTWVEAARCEGLSSQDCNKKRSNCIRGSMTRDLLQNHLIIGETTRDMTAALLGPKEYDVEIQGQSCAAYALGMCSGFRIDQDSLYVCYRENSIISLIGEMQHRRKSSSSKT